ncbi:MAG: CheR family methyltransferase [Candidatus Hermodarchaeota archaeon]
MALTAESKSMDILIDKLKDITGIKFEHYQRKFLEKRIKFRIRDLDFNSHEEYLQHLSKDPEEINKFLDKFTINYTYFFRNYEVFEKLEEFIRTYVNGLKRPLRIWSAPCATGDEPYSISILLDKLKNKVINFPDYEIVASDIDSKAIEIAKAGIYGEYSLHETSKNDIQTYFKKEDSAHGPKFTLNNNIKEKVELIQEDIIKGHNKKSKYDIILCRNFLIYVDRASRERLFRLFENCIVDGGILVLGKTETIMDVNTSFKSIDNVDRLYVKNKLIHDFKFKKEIKVPVNRIKKKVKTQPNKKKVPDKLKQTIKTEIKEDSLDNNSLLKPQPEVVELNRKISEEEKMKTLELKERELEKREMQIMRRLNELQVREEQLNKREIYLNQKDVLIGLRETDLEQRLIKIKEKEEEIAKFQNDIDLDNNKTQKKSGFNGENYQITKPNIKNELNVPICHYAIINLYDKNNKASKFSAYGICSGIVLILKDSINKVYAMSYISHPRSRKPKNGSKVKIPHKFVDTSVDDLVDKILYHGANRENITAILVGGANDIYDQHIIHQKNIDAILKKLYSKHITIEKEFLGGISERSIIYDTEKNSLSIKKAWEDNFRKII